MYKRQVQYLLQHAASDLVGGLLPAVSVGQLEKEDFFATESRLVEDVAVLVLGRVLAAAQHGTAACVADSEASDARARACVARRRAIRGPP